MEELTKMYVCEHCAQIGFADTLKPYNGKMVCHRCFFELNEQFYSWESVDKLAIKMMMGSGFADYNEVVVPLSDNLDEEMIGDEYPTLKEAFEELKEKWEGMKWGYEGGVKDMELVPVPDIDKETVRDDEFYDLWIYKELAYTPELYARPFDLNPQDLYFSGWFAADCYRGGVYSKDFGYELCECCQREVCVQNPSNGWMSQIHVHDGWVECNKCYEERVLEDGINEDFDGNIPGGFFEYEDIKENGWEIVQDSVLAGSGTTGHRDPGYAIGIIENLIDDGKKVLVNYEHMAIGGLGGYVSVYAK